MGLRQILGQTALGTSMPLTWAEVGQFLRTRYLGYTEVTGTVGIDGSNLPGVLTVDPTRTDAERRRKARERVDVYSGRGKTVYERMIGDLFEHQENRDRYRKLLPYSQFQDSIGRIVRDLSTVYAAPAARDVDNGTSEAYTSLLDAMMFDAWMDSANRMANLCNCCLAWIRARKVQGEVQPRLDVITPDAFAAVADPADPLSMIAVIIDTRPGGYRASAQDPHYQVWTDDEIVRLDGRGTVMEGTVEPNPYGVIPGVLIHRELPVGCLIDGDSGADLMAGHLAALVLNTTMLTGQTSGTRQAYAAGDVKNMARGQRIATESILEVPAEVTMGVLDTGIDPNGAIAAARSTVAQVAANYGIPEDAFTLAGTNGAAAQQIRRQMIRERRLRQVPLYRAYERELVKLLARWVEVSGPAEFRFDTDGWTIDFVEVAEPMAPLDLQRWREGEVHAGRASNLDFIRADNPDFDEAQAREWQLQKLAETAEWVTLARALNVRTDVTAENPGMTPQDNGAMGGRPPMNGNGTTPPDGPA